MPSGACYDASVLLDRCDVTTHPKHMLLLPTEGEQADKPCPWLCEVVLHVPVGCYIAGMLVHNYNASPDATSYGVREIECLVDGTPLSRSYTGQDQDTADGGGHGDDDGHSTRATSHKWSLSPAPGDALTDFCQLVCFGDVHASGGATETQPHSAGDATTAPLGTSLLIAFPGTFSSAYPFSLPVVDLIDASGQSVDLSEALVFKFPAHGMTGAGEGAAKPADQLKRSQAMALEDHEISHSGAFIRIQLPARRCISAVKLMFGDEAEPLQGPVEAYVDGHLVGVLPGLPARIHDDAQADASATATTSTEKAGAGGSLLMALSCGALR